ncbi:MAG TPA: aminotransferase class I/II-fold pyridoxal phosphate-dependent enzyme [Myxococcota bacterium]|nr:aminotransferase class I/II-fold pyridoxal phosphate-dependent enzyme [Myxococcota bacterium]HOH76641.1 aminotransferase class I/II-fold pyridoxal phosphate-dependent enzyme [Myxococcota bacterium]HPV04686.1 aminotransferase class I/II-fold pyridoxal phosphate-dependent enzyme [Myxococcota bacterium]
MHPVPRHNINLDQKEMVAVITEILTGTVTAGPGDVAAFEREIASYHNVSQAVAVSSGRAAQCAVMKAMNLAPGSEVIVPSYSFFTVPGVVRALGHVPVFAPCDPGTFAIDPARLESVITDRTSAVIVIHPFGQPAPVDQIAQICGRRGIHLIEDASQSIGATLRQRRVGSFGHASCMSLVHGKNLMTFGGGVVLTDDDRLASAIRSIVARNRPEKSIETRKKALAGLANWALTTKPGFAVGLLPPFWLLNFVSRERLDSIFVEKEAPFDPDSIRPLSPFQARLGMMQLGHLDARNAVRRHNAERLIRGLSDIDWMTLPECMPGASCTFNAVPVRVANPTDVQRELLMHGIDTRADYMTVYDDHEAWKQAGEIFYLPNHPGMNDADIDAVIRQVRAIARPRKA